MTPTKEIEWFNRAPLGPKKDVYLFWKSFATIQNKDLLQKYIASVGQLAHEDDENNSSLSSDPLLMYVLGLKKSQPSFDSIVRYYEQDAEKHQDGIPFVDICLYLDRVCDARKFALAHHLAFNIAALDHTEIKKDSSLPYEEECSQTWLRVLERRNDVPHEQLVNSAELFAFALRFASGEKMNVISEMSGRGYLWDSFILMSLFYPDYSATNRLKAAVWKSYSLDWIEELICSSNVDQVAHLLEIGVKPAVCYEQLKLHLIKNIQNEFLRSTLYTEIRICLVSAVSDDDGDLAYFDIAKDLLNFALTEPTILAEFLPAMQKNYFEQAFVIMSDLIKVVLHLSNVATIGLVQGYEADTRGIVHSIVDGWVKLQVLPEEKISLIRSMKGINDILYSFIGDVVDSSKILAVGIDCKDLVLLALRIGEVMFNGKLGERNDTIIFDIVKSNGRCNECIQKLLQSESNNDLPPVIDTMVESVHRTLRRVQNLIDSQKTQTGPSFSNMQEEDFIKSCASRPVPTSSFDTNFSPCHISISTEDTSITQESISLVETTSIVNTPIHKKEKENNNFHAIQSPIRYPPTNIVNAKTALDMLFEQSLSVPDDIQEKEVAITSHSAEVVVQEVTTSPVNCSSSQSTVSDWAVSSQSTDSGKEASVSESSHSSPRRTLERKTESFSSNFESEITNIWSNNRNAKQYNHFQGPLGKVSGGFGGSNGESPISNSGFGDAPPQRGRGGFRRGGYSGGRNSDGIASNTGYGGRGSYQRRGAYVPRGSRGGFS